MKKIWILGLITVTFLSGCSTIPSTPTPHLHAYSFQILEIDIPLSTLRSEWNVHKSNSSLAGQNVESMFKAPKVQLYEYPIIYAELGKPAYLEKITNVSFVEDFIVVDGKAITQEAGYKLGTTIKITLDHVDRDVASFSIDLGTKNLKGYNTIDAAGAKIQIPVFFEKQLVTSMQHELNSWMSLGAIEDINRKKGKTIRKYFVIRIIPPYVDS